MSEETLDQEPSDALSRWWWPGQWLRIVWGVWVDQKWYWQTVRPRLHGRKQGWEIVIQSLLGGSLVALAFSPVARGVLRAIGLQVNWKTIVLSVVVGVGLNAIAGSVWGLVGGVPSSVPVISTGGLCLTVYVSLNGSVMLSALAGTADYGSLDVLATTLGMYIARMAVLGVVTGVVWGAVTGDRENILSAIVTGTLLSFLSGDLPDEETMSIVTKLIWRTVAGLNLGCVVYLGKLWATRQISDVETRKQLANPDSDSLSSILESGDF